MQITLNLDEALLEEALQLTKFSTQEELMNLALQELVRSRRKKNRLSSSYGDKQDLLNGGKGKGGLMLGSIDV
ncbi:type II toxin-antitoxin system VapB family antitoxin [Chamaesiphon sp. VAR_48_metabat_135_sub]|uniref:type II toxin-antitoxin system VapB family antitoxin n=1 Tax=Chamaesiphon sp. VAR_48_metabat_135_sub TaxID=2964699 RepID=UPI00286B251A|nr:type II toxin-antitoxin system VapB family antitoxin [Chamaesiphon sp. VAR_48_metabat_135_sub]